jgi:hypothetical protein
MKTKYFFLCGKRLYYLNKLHVETAVFFKKNSTGYFMSTLFPRAFPSHILTYTSK